MESLIPFMIYDWDALDQLNEEGYTIDKQGNKSLYITEESEQSKRDP